MLYFIKILFKKEKINFNKYKKYKIRLTLDYLEDIKFFETILLSIIKNKNKIILKIILKIIKNNKDIIKINFFRNFDYQII